VVGVSTENSAYPLASRSSRGVRVSTPRAWGLFPVLPPGGVLPRFVSLLWRCPGHGDDVSRCLRYPQSSSFLPTHRTSYATRAAVRPPRPLPYRTRGMHNAGYELRRITLPRTPVNKGRSGTEAAKRARPLPNPLRHLLSGAAGVPDPTHRPRSARGAPLQVVKFSFLAHLEVYGTY
jgi:hypothetical protein